MTNEDEQVTRRQLEALVRRSLADRVGSDVANQIGAAEPFADVGIDSLDLVYVVSALDRKVPSVPRGADLWTIADSVDSLVGYLRSGGLPAGGADVRPQVS